ncbi:MAG: [protein-PII] uridylyltransferase [gamma proteobacterium symbiont of Lucinoma myriamae]|nr:[protein-PII] uridylyltransferase [gamma proteobacterium symbiont of Lucinoma myriamae]MCU7818946.1 [protein-PII] uridylyltransferase [gamma proteobacterium symbiont of Lucinoma myriamae]MCU7831971.1 [protein-PII] uridylyltransferase [gamma proteobacterium symbiont of Lucinoma myriamae]
MQLVIPPSLELLFDFSELEAELAESKTPLLPLKKAVKSIYEKQIEQFQNKQNIVHLIKERSQAIDIILSMAWSYYNLGENAALLAVGGYGRGELHPYSDVDLLLLHDAEHDLEDESGANKEFVDNLHFFIALLWDIGLEIGHSVRTVDECIKEAENDITIISNLMESRLITGDKTLYEQLSSQLGPENIWPTKDFTAAKIQEKNKRYLKFNETAYNLEPNIKEGPGGLRDIQIIGWVAKRHFGVESLKDLVGHNFLTLNEYEQLEQGQNFLWKIRFALHVLCKRHEERLLFDYQRELAQQFGYTDCEGKLAVESFMADYYQNVMELERLNEMLLQYFQEVIIFSDSDAKPIKINRRFINYKGYIAATNQSIFRNYPFALLEIFLMLCQDPELKGVRASTIRLIRAHCYLIDDSFRKDLRCRTLFMEILRQPFGITHEMRRMNRYGVLAAYIPEFKQIVGQMQHDLYHAYTVDEHTLKVLRNARRLFVPEHAHELPLASKVAHYLPKPELLYLAALFHDIGKGRGGRHEELGAIDAEQFCQLHDLNLRDTRLVSWLVRNHLIMSMTAQRKDINDPAVIHEFALLVGESQYLDYLYMLTVSDIRATSPKVWNSWKDSLLTQLYNLTKIALNKGLENPLQHDECIKDCKAIALGKLLDNHYSQENITQLWSSLPKEYFIKFQVEEIIWQTETILDVYKQDPERILCTPDLTSKKPIILIKPHEERGGTEIFIYTLEVDHLFAMVTATLSQLLLEVTEAKTVTSSNGCTYHTYFVLEGDGSIVTDNERIETIKQTLEEKLSQEKFAFPALAHRLSRTEKQFSHKTTVHFDEDLENNQTLMTITASNRPALLSHIGQALIECHVHLDNAKISTFGEKVEDVFIIRDENKQIITDIKKQEAIRRAIIRLVDEME